MAHKGIVLRSRIVGKTGQNSSEIRHGRWPWGREPQVKRRTPFPENIPLCLCVFLGPEVTANHFGSHFPGSRRGPRVVSHTATLKVNVAGRPGGRRRPRGADFGPPAPPRPPKILKSSGIPHGRLHSRPTDPPAKAKDPRPAAPPHHHHVSVTLCYAIVLPGRKSGFRA